MKVNEVEKKEKSIVQFAVDFTAQEFDDALNTAYRKNKGSIMIPGFRKGKAPRMIVEKMYGDSVFYDDALDVMCPDAFEKGKEEHALRTVGAPSVSDFKVGEDKSITVTFQTAVYPEVTLGTYKGLSAPKGAVSVSAADVKAELETLQKRNARIVSVDRPAKLGDTALIDFKGFIGDTAFEGGEAEQQSLELGSKTFIPGFEDQLVGAKAGDELDVTVTFPEDYAEELKGKDAVFKVKVHEVKESSLPELDDEFAKDVSEFDTLADYKKSVKERLTEEREKQARNAFEEKLLEKATAEMTVDIPQAMIEEQAKNLAQEFYYNISAQGIKPEDYLQMIGMDPETFNRSNMGTAERQIKTRLLMETVAEVEGLETTDEDVEKKYEEMAKNYEMELDKIKELLKPETVKSDILMEKAGELIYSSATAEAPEKEKKEPKTEDEKKEAAEKPAKKAAKKTEKADAADGEAEAKPAAKKKKEDDGAEADKPKKKPAAKKAPKKEQAEE